MKAYIISKLQWNTLKAFGQHINEEVLLELEPHAYQVFLGSVVNKYQSHNAKAKYMIFKAKSKATYFSVLESFLCFSTGQAQVQALTLLFIGDSKYGQETRLQIN